VVPEVKQSGRGFDHPPSNRAEVENGKGDATVSPLCLRWHVTEWPLFLPSIYVYRVISIPLIQVKLTVLPQSFLGRNKLFCMKATLSFLFPNNSKFKKS
jgi:hypothetical protein